MWNSRGINRDVFILVNFKRTENEKLPECHLKGPQVEGVQREDVQVEAF